VSQVWLYIKDEYISMYILLQFIVAAWVVLQVVIVVEHSERSISSPWQSNTVEVMFERLSIDSVTSTLLEEST